jgi:lipopolysaccharide transport system permease protein
MTSNSTRSSLYGHAIDVILPTLPVFRHRLVFRQFLARSISSRYRLSVFGLLWTVMVPLFTLLIYTLVFGVILQSRWSGADGGGDTTSFGLYLFVGLLVFWLMADVVGGTPNAIIVMQMRRILLDGQQPDWLGLGIYFVVAWLVASVGLAFFRYARKGFADVL